MRKPKVGGPACAGCGMPVWTDEPEPARLCCKRAWSLLGGGRRREHYMSCGVCGQQIDLRDLGSVIAHEAPHDGPIDVRAVPIVGSLGERQAGFPGEGGGT